MNAFFYFNLKILIKLMDFSLINQKEQKKKKIKIKKKKKKK